MDPVDVNRLIEQARADASATGVSTPPKAPRAGQTDTPTPSPDTKKDIIDNILAADDEVVQHLAEAVMDLAAAEEEEAKARDLAAIERGRHVKMAKVLAAIDVLSGVQR